MFANITPDRVAQIIVRARELEARVGPWAEFDRLHPDEEEADSVLEARRQDPARQALVAFLSELSEEALAELVALMWLGRGAFGPEEWTEALRTAREEHTGVAGSVRYLLGEPLLADYLEEGLDRLGYTVSRIEDDVR